MIRRILTEGMDEFDLTQLSAYQARGGYEALRKALGGMTPEEVAGEVKTSGLRGRGGAGFPTWLKWSTLPEDGRPRYLLINGDESEPGSFSGRMLIEKNPHMIIEGILLSAFATKMTRSFVYLRGEFYEGYAILSRAVEEARAAGLVGEHILGSDFSQEIVIHRGAGAYICGEETAIMESLEGKRGHPRVKPPFPTAVGAYGMPTVINNVETIANVAAIVAHGGAWFAAIGPEKSPGTKICSVSGRVRRPGNYEIEMGTPLRELIEEHAGGLEPGHEVKFILPAGASSALIKPQNLDVSLDFDSMGAIRSMLGSAGMLVCDDRDCPVHVAYLGARFYHHESCGKCTPCREGTGWTERVLERMEHGRGRPGDTELLESLVRGIGGKKTLCLLGDFSVTYLGSALANFRDEFVAHESGGPCPVASRREVAMR